MTEARTIETGPSSRGKTAIGRLFVLELNAGRIHSMNTDGSDKKTIVTGCHLPDGIAVDVEAGHIYWTNMGLTPEVRQKLIDGLHAEVGSRSIPDLEAQRDEVLLGLLELRNKYEKPSALSQTTQARRSRALS